MSNIYDVLIIGGGVGGIKCATICHKKKLKTLLIDSNDILGGQLSVLYPQKTITNVSEYKPIKAYELVNKLIDELHNTDIDILLGTKLKEVYKHDNIFHIILSNNEYINTKNIIIATGPGEFTPNKLNFDNKNISYFVNNIDDYKNKKVVILGGGDSAVDWANELYALDITKDITIIHRRNEFKAKEENVQKLKLNNIKILLDFIPIDATEHTLIIKSNSNNLTQEISYDKIIVQYGCSVNNEISKILNVNINDQKKILVDNTQLTNLKQVYAIGDCCYYENKQNLIDYAFNEAQKCVEIIINN